MNDDTLAARVEDAGLNAAATPLQRWMDGWIVRLSPGKAKRARCINAVAPGRRPLDDKLAECDALYAAAGVPMFFRVTPFTAPATLDADLDARGFHRVDDTRVMVTSQLPASAEPARHTGARFAGWTFDIGRLSLLHDDGRELSLSAAEAALRDAAALARMPADYSPLVAYTEYWSTMDAPNLMLELCEEDVTDLLVALTQHVGEVSRNPYHMTVPAWMMDNVRRGAERVGLPGAVAPDFTFAVLHQLQRWRAGQLTPAWNGGRFINVQHGMDGVG